MLGILLIFFDQGPRFQKVQGSKVQVLGGLLLLDVDLASAHSPAQTTKEAVRTLVPAVDVPTVRAKVATVQPATLTVAIAEADVVVPGKRVLIGLAVVLEGSQHSLLRARNRTSPAFRQSGTELLHHLDCPGSGRTFASRQHPVGWVGDKDLESFRRDPLHLCSCAVLKPLAVALEKPRIVLTVEAGVELTNCLMQEHQIDISRTDHIPPVRKHLPDRLVLSERPFRNDDWREGDRNAPQEHLELTPVEPAEMLAL